MKLNQDTDIVLVVNPRRWKEYRFSIGLLCISSYLKKYGYKNVILERKLLSGAEYSKELAEKLLLEKICEIKPKVIGFSATVSEVDEIIRLNDRIKEIYPSFISIVGGPHATACPADFINRGLDVVVIGEGEATALELIREIEKDNPDFSKIEGIVWKDKQIKINPQRSYIDISNLPLLAYNKIDMPYHTSIGDGIIRGLPLKTVMVFGSRGCPYNCSFCGCNRVFGRKVRYKSYKIIKEELILLRDKYGVEGIWFADDTFTVQDDYVLNICQIMKEIGLVWGAQARIDLTKEEIVKKMAQSGCLQLDFGIESGSQRILNEIIHKGTKIEQALESFKLCRKYGIRTLANLMMGFPTETYQEMEQTFEFAKKLKANFYVFSICTPLPGTPLFEKFFFQEIVDDDYKDLQFFTGQAKFNKSHVENLRELNLAWRRKLTNQTKRRTIFHPFLFIKIFFRFSHKKERIKFMLNKFKNLIKFIFRLNK